MRTTLGWAIYKFYIVHKGKMQNNAWATVVPVVLNIYNYNECCQQSQHGTEHKQPNIGSRGMLTIYIASSNN